MYYAKEACTDWQQRFDHLIRRQVPDQLIANKRIGGLQFDDISIKTDKLYLKLKGCFEAVFYLNFDLPPEFFVPDD